MAESNTEIVVTMRGRRTTFTSIGDYGRFCRGEISLEQYRGCSARDKVASFSIKVVEGVEFYPNGQRDGENS